MRPWSRFRFLFLVLAAVSIFFSSVAVASSGTVASGTASTSTSPANIVIGFVGGFVNSDNQHHGPVLLAKRIRQNSPQGTLVRVFENRRRRQAYQLIVHLLDADRNGVLSAEEKTRARIILFGHSWGASAAVMLARELREQGIPVSLTVQVDSVAKWWQNDSVIPDNVAEAVNFYQTQGIIHGRRVITAADPAKTQILGNYLVDYRKNPVHCPEASWWDRIITPGHMESECDSRLWSNVESLVRERISGEASAPKVASVDSAHASR